MITKRTYASGGNIHIKPENRGKFTSWASSHGMNVADAARHIMANKAKYSGSVVKMANFAKNAAGWNKQEGGTIGDPPATKNDNLNTLRGLLHERGDDSWMHERFPWMNPERAWWGGDTNLGPGSQLYINDAGNLERKPRPRVEPKLQEILPTLDDKLAAYPTKENLFIKPTAKQSSTAFSNEAAKMRTQFATPLFGKGGSIPEQVNAMRLTPSRYSSYEDVIHALKNRQAK